MRMTPLRIGFVPLIDAAPLIVAQERGFFREEALDVSLHRQVGWANVRDKLSFGHLDASHALLGMPLSSYLGREFFGEPLVSLMALGTGGNAITVRKELHDLGVRSASSLRQVMFDNPRLGRLVVGHVFNCSMHHYLVREWLASGGIDPDRETKLCVVPPPQVSEHMKGGYLDIFCVGEPWNLLATRMHCGVAVLATTDLVPSHPEKVLAVTRRFASQHPTLLVPLVRALLRACAWCDDKGNQDALAAMLAQPAHLALPVELIRQSLSLDRSFGASPQQRNVRPAGWTLRSFSPAATFPSKTHFLWMLQEMIRWNHLHAEADLPAIAERCVDTGPYRAAASDLHIECPAEDFPPMPLRHGELTLETRAVPTQEYHGAEARRPPVAERSVNSPRGEGVYQ